jgi:phospholipid/cholesterol/gamma-HCH transport system substrate-binding protein
VDEDGIPEGHVSSEVKVGILFFLGLGFVFWLTFFMTDVGQARGNYQIRFNRVSRLKEGDAVTYNGVHIGNITDLAPVLGEDGQPQVQVSFSVQASRRKVVLIDAATIFQIDQGLLGGGALDIISHGGQPITPEGLHGRVGSDPTGIDEVLAGVKQVIDENRAALHHALTSVQGGMDKFGDMSAEIDSLIKENRQTITDAIHHINTMTQRIGDVVEDNRATLKSAIQHIDSLTGQLDQVVTENRANVRAALGKLPATIDNVGGAGKSVQTVVDENRGDIRATIARLARITDNLQVITDQIASGKGTIGKLVFDDDLHDKAVATIDNLNQRLEEIKPVTSGFADFRFYLGVDGGGDTRSGVTDTYVYLRVEPRPWKFYEAGISYRTAPTGRQTIPDDPNALNVDINLLFGWRFFPDDQREVYHLSTAAGLIDGQPGGYLESALNQNLCLRLMMRGKDNQRNPLDRRYEQGALLGRLYASYTFWRRVSLEAGVDDTFRHPGPWLALRGELLDNDLRNITAVSGLVH